MAEALFKDLLSRGGESKDWRVESAGVWAFEGVSATQMAREVMRERGLNIEGHRSRPVDKEMLSEFDLVLVMENRHCSELRRLYPEFADRIQMMSAIAGPAENIDDPVTGTMETYRTTVEIMLDLLERGFDQVLEWTADSR